MEIRAIGTRLIVEPHGVAAEQVTPGGIILPGTKSVAEGTVISVGPETYDPLIEGSLVFYHPEDGVALEFEGETFVSIEDTSILAIARESWDEDDEDDDDEFDDDDDEDDD